ncbi:MAG: protein-L-isoaspartate(D-aspartate) O-methyltransferase [Vicinamibacteria bacterium]
MGTTAMNGVNGHGEDPDIVMAARRARMMEEQLVRRGIHDPRVLEAMGRIERHRFVPDAHLVNAYGDFPVPIGGEQTLSQPYIVGLMSEALALQGHEKVLDIGTGSGYQTAVLAELARVVYTVEFIPELAARARDKLLSLGYQNVHFRVGDGREGWPEAGPFDGILVGAAPLTVPPKLLEQLTGSGRLVLPVGGSTEQELELHERDPIDPGKFRVRSLGAVRFVPLV